MIRIAFFGVIALAGLLALGAFYLAKGSEGEPVQITTGTPDGPSPAAAAPATPEVEMLFFLRGIDFDIGEITLVLFDAKAEQERLIIRDQQALRAVTDRAYVNTKTSNGEAAGSLLLAMMGAVPEETIAQIFRDDVLIASVTCTNTACGRFSDSPDIDYAGLPDHAVPFQTIEDQFDNYETYLATIDAIASDPNYMLLDQRPLLDFPLLRRPGHLIVELPNVVTNDASFDPALHEALVQSTITPLLPEGATLEWVRATDQGPGILSDKDNTQPVLVNGTPLAFPDVRFFTVRARVNGVTTLSSDVYNALAAATLRQIDIDAALPGFITTSLGASACVDCFVLNVEGGLSDEARAFDWRSETYYLNYYDLREAP